MLPIHHLHTAWLRRTVTVVVGLLASLILSSTSHAQDEILVPNASITGDLGKLLTLRSQVHNSPCLSRRCRFRSPPLHLAVKAHGYSSFQVSLRELRDPRFIIRELPNQSVANGADRPLLFRGTARIRHSGAHGETATVPVAGSIVFKGNRAYLEVSTFQHSRRGAKSRGLIIVRAPLSSTRTGDARAQRSSSYAFKDSMCGTHSSNSLEHSDESAPHNDVTAQAAYDVLYVATDFDQAWYSAMGCQSVSDCNNKVVTLVNRTSLFYEQQLGITVEVARQYGPTTHSSTTSSSDLLTEFRAYNERYRASVLHDGNNTGANLVDLFQLYTGRTMDDKVVGVAFLGVMCRNVASTAAHMVVGRKSDTADPVIAAHELGHTLDANHSPSGIMAAVLGSTPPTSFSQISVSEMSAHYNTYKFECRGGTSPGAPHPPAAPDETPAAPPTPNTPPEVPETLKLSVKKTGKNVYTIKTTVSSLRAACFVRIRAGESEEDAATGTIITSYIPRVRTTSRKGIVNGSISASNLADATVYLTAEYQCSGDQVFEASPFKRISPNTGKRSAPKVTRRQWISLLNKAL